jgi:hypothetical protein
MPATLTTAEKAPILTDADVPLSNSRYLATVDGPAAAIGVDADNNLVLVGQQAGTVNVTATDSLNGGVAVLEVTVTTATFQIKLGAPVPK